MCAPDSQCTCAVFSPVCLRIWTHQHVLRFEGLLLARTLLPAAHELLLLPVDVFVIDVLRTHKHNSSLSLCVSDISPPFVMSALCLRSNWPCRFSHVVPKNSTIGVVLDARLRKIKQFELLRSRLAYRRAALSITSVLRSPRLSDGNKKCDGVWLWESVFLNPSLVMDEKPQIWERHKYANTITGELTNSFKDC